MEYTLIANSGIQIFTFRLKINKQDRFKEWYREWYDNESGEWKLELVQEVRTEDITAYFKKIELYKAGYYANTEEPLDIDELRHDGIFPIQIDDQICEGVEGEIYSLTLLDKGNCMSSLENEWLPIPYFFKRAEHK